MRGISTTLLQGMGEWHQGKLFIENQLRFSHDSLHILAGVLVWIAAGLLSRRSLAGWLPWLCVFVAIAWNEAVDLALEHVPTRGWAYGESAKDLVMTLFVPTVLMFIVRLRPDLFQAQGARRRRR